MTWTEKDLQDLREVMREAIDNALVAYDEPDDVLEKNVWELIVEYADNQFTDLHEYAEDEIKQSFTTENEGGGQGHIQVMQVADKWCSQNFIRDFRTIHADILEGK